MEPKKLELQKYANEYNTIYINTQMSKIQSAKLQK